MIFINVGIIPISIDFKDQGVKQKNSFRNHLLIMYLFGFGMIYYSKGYYEQIYCENYFHDCLRFYTIFTISIQCYLFRN